MLLGDELLSDAQLAARVWLIRERAEHEAAAHFARLASDLRAAHAPDAIVALAMRASEDERRHAVRCREVVDDLAPGLAALPRDRGAVIGPPGGESQPAARATHAAVAIGCITETLSTALLIELRRRAHHPVARRAFDEILEDEIAHARLGWATLAWRAGQEDLAHIGPHVRAMIDAAVVDEPSPSERSLAHLGILEPRAVREICETTVRTTILPGLARFGISIGP